jgi:hypothetical protein
MKNINFLFGKINSTFTFADHKIQSKLLFLNFTEIFKFFLKNQIL